MRIERVAGQPRIGQVVFEAFDVGQMLHSGIHVLHLLLRELVLGLEHLTAARRLMARARGIELKRAMRHSNLVPVIEERERMLESALAQIAPRADDIGPDVDVH